MRKSIFLILPLLFFTASIFAKNGNDSASILLAQQLKLADSVINAMKWQTGTVLLPNSVVKLNLPPEFKFLNAEQSQYIVHNIWNNPPRPDVLGMIFPADATPYTDSSFAFIITYDEEGYVKDDDADKINYTDMMDEIKKEEPDNNKKRAEDGYQPMYILGWAETPYYDKTNKVLHWAKELQFGDDSVHTLNYDVRVLGRKGVLSLNAVSTMDELPLVKANIDKVLQIPSFTDGNKYSDFNSSTDKVAEYTIGALVAGGILAKTGLLAIIGKFFLVAWKFILLGIAASWRFIKKLFTRKKDKGDEIPGITNQETQV